MYFTFIKLNDFKTSHILRIAWRQYNTYKNVPSV